jgi:hypothetical protein
MRHAASLLLVPLLVAGASLGAQTPRMGFSLNLTFPTGDFASTTYPAYVSSYSGHLIPPQKESYDVGYGGSFTMSWPMDRHLAFRMIVSASTEDGTNRAAGESTLTLRHTMASFGGDFQIFPQGGALQHRGLYLVGGLSADSERFERGYGDLTWGALDATHRSRLGANAGLGHAFGYGAGTRFTLEATFHKTLTAHDVVAGDPPSSDFTKVAFGWIF